VVARAALAPKARHAALEHAAHQELAELALDELRQARARPELETPFVTARTPVERVLAGIWEEVLGLDRVGIHDDFLDLGGHSLLATQIASRIRDVFRADVPLRPLFEAATVADMTVTIVQHVAEKVECDRPEPPWAEVERLSEDEVRRRLTDDA